MLLMKQRELSFPQTAISSALPSSLCHAALSERPFTSTIAGTNYTTDQLHRLFDKTYVDHPFNHGVSRSRWFEVSMLYRVCANASMNKPGRLNQYVLYVKLLRKSNLVDVDEF